jgi:hypothetical protein
MHFCRGTNFEEKKNRLCLFFRFGCTAFGAGRSPLTSTASLAGGVAERIITRAVMVTQQRWPLSVRIAAPAAIPAQWASTPGISFGLAFFQRWRLKLRGQKCATNCGMAEDVNYVIYLMFESSVADPRCLSRIRDVYPGSGSDHFLSSRILYKKREVQNKPYIFLT